MVRQVEFYHSAVFGSGNWDYDELDSIKKLARSWGATGLELKFDSLEFPDERALTYLEAEKSDPRPILEVVDEVSKDFDLNLHLSKYVIPLISNPQRLGFEFLKNFNKIIVHESYGKKFVQTLCEGLTQEELGFEKKTIDPSQVLFENHTKRHNWLRPINKLIYTQYDSRFGAVFDMGHFFLQFYKEKDIEKPLDDPMNYFRPTFYNREIDHGLLKWLATPIKEAHVHLCRPAGNYTKDHCPIDSKIRKSWKARKIYEIEKCLIQKSDVEVCALELSTDFQKADNAREIYKTTKKNFKRKFLS